MKLLAVADKEWAWVRWATSSGCTYVTAVDEEGVMSMTHPADFSTARVITDCVNASVSVTRYVIMSGLNHSQDLESE